MLFVKVYTLRIDKLEFDSFLSNNENKYLFLDAPFNTTIFAARSSQNKRGNLPAKKFINRILCKWIEKENSYTTSKNVRLKKWKLVKMRHNHQYSYLFKSLVKSKI